MLRTILLLALIAAQAGAAAAATLERVSREGAIRLGYRTDARPYSYRDSQGQPAGYVVELCLQVATAMQPRVRLEFVPVSAAERFEAVKDGRVDILCDPSTVTIERREIVDFSIPTFLDGASVLFRSGKPVQRFEDLAGKRVGVLQGTTTERVLTRSLADLGIKATVTQVTDHPAGFDLLSSNRIDAYFADRAIIAALLNEGGRPGFELSRTYFSYETYALALPRDDSAFRLFVDRTLARLYRTGRINSILARSFGKAPSDDMLKALFLIHALPEQ